jgi:hypothetical protein
LPADTAKLLAADMQTKHNNIKNRTNSFINTRGYFFL